MKSAGSVALYRNVLTCSDCLKLKYGLFNIYGSMHHKHISVYIQQDVTLHSLFISGNCSTCFGWYLHPSSGAHTTVSTASVICHTVMDKVKLLIKCIWRCKNIVRLKSSWTYHLKRINTLRTRSFKLFKRPFPGFLTILTL